MMSRSARNLLIVIPILVASAVTFSDPSRFEITPQQQAADFLVKQMTEMTEKLLKDFPDNFHLVKLSAEFHLQCYKYNKAMMILEKGLKSHPHNFELCKITADVALKKGEYDKAASYWQKAVDISPEKTDLYDNIADALMSAGRHQEAVNKLEEKMIRARRRMSDRSYYFLGQGYMQLGDYQKAEKYFKKTLDLNPQYSMIDYSLAKVYLRLKQRDKAKEHMEAHTKLERERKKSRQNWMSKNEREVIDVVARIRLSKLPEKLISLTGGGSKLYLRRGDKTGSLDILELGEKIFEGTIERASEKADLYRHLASLYFVTNIKPEKAKLCAQKAVELKKSSMNYLTLFAVCNKSSDRVGAISALEGAIALEPENQKLKKIYNEIKREGFQ